MRIGIDIDGVLNSQYNFCIDYGSKFCYELANLNMYPLYLITPFINDINTNSYFANSTVTLFIEYLDS